VGYVRKGKEISGKNIKAGDIVLGLSSSGPHSNGYSLIRKVLTPAQMKKYSKALICPTKIYVKPVIGAIKKFNKNTQNITGIAHITGGSFYDKIGRILPKGLGVRIDKNSWAVPEIFNIIKHAAKIDEMEMYKTLNMGIGMVLIVRKTMAENIKKFFKDAKIIGHVAKSKNSVEIV
jgi:phosphoribosylformylglycinamidine cyclo-ligase